jgi:uncharacterized protein
LSSPATPQNPPLHEAVAPAWHTVIVLLIFLGLSLLGFHRANLTGVGKHGRVPGYVLTIVIEWLITAFIWYGARSRGVRMRELIGGRWNSFIDFLRDLGIAIVFVIVCGGGVMSGIAHLLKSNTPASVRNLLPQGRAEIVVYLLVAATAGFCEELIFRGYLQRQFAALTRSAAGGLILQGIAFGAAHGYQGWKLMVAIAIFGITFGLLAMWRQSLRPGMLAHFVQDGVGGILGRHLMH